MALSAIEGSNSSPRTAWIAMGATTLNTDTPSIASPHRTVARQNGTASVIAIIGTAALAITPPIPRTRLVEISISLHQRLAEVSNTPQAAVETEYANATRHAARR